VRLSVLLLANEEINNNHKKSEQNEPTKLVGEIITLLDTNLASSLHVFTMNQDRCNKVEDIANH